jgi:hypothetical protein
MRNLFLCGLAVVLASCGGAVEDGAPSPAPATNTPNSFSDADGCSRACDRMTKTCAAYRDPQCTSSCAANLHSPEQEDAFASCIDALSCDDIRRGVTMNYGPIGECWSRALGQ